MEKHCVSKGASHVHTGSKHQSQENVYTDKRTIPSGTMSRKDRRARGRLHEGIVFPVGKHLIFRSTIGRKAFDCVLCLLAISVLTE